LSGTNLKIIDGTLRLRSPVSWRRNLHRPHGIFFNAVIHFILSV
jgi:hypothetical protein